MYNGVKAMIAAEKQLASGAQPAAAADTQCGPNLKKPEDITGFPVFPEGTTSALSKNLTRELWDELKDK